MKATIVYDVIAKRHSGSSRSNVVLFYDYDREEAVKFMGDYDRKNGFTIKDPDGLFTIANIILRERYSTGEVISETPYCQIFDIHGKRIKESGQS